MTWDSSQIIVIYAPNKPEAQSIVLLEAVILKLSASVNLSVAVAVTKFFSYSQTRLL
jgi:hypothetical protein